MSHAGITAVLAKGKSQKQKVKKVKRERERFESAFHKFAFRFLACFFFCRIKGTSKKTQLENRL